MRTAGGILLILAGILAIAMPFVAGSITVLMVGFLMIIGGFVEILHAFGRPSWGQRIAWIILGLLMAIAGLVVVGHPLLGLDEAGSCLAGSSHSCWESFSGGSGLSPGSGPWARSSGSTSSSTGPPSWARGPMKRSAWDRPRNRRI